MEFLYFRLNLVILREKKCFFKDLFSEFLDKYSKRGIDQFLVNR